MPIYQLWVKDAQPEQQGSFCDTASRYHYQNVNGLSALIEISQAEARKDDILIMDRTPESEAYNLDERFNLFRTTEDRHGMLTPALQSVESAY